MRHALLVSMPLTLAVAGVATVCHAAPAVPPPANMSPPTQAVDPQSEFEKARNAYRAQQYEEADARFLRLLDPAHPTLTDKVLVEQARMYWAATQLALHNADEATRLFETILKENRDYEPDPLSFPTDVINTFIDVKRAQRDQLKKQEEEEFRQLVLRRANAEAAKAREAARIKALEKLASEVEVTQKHSRWVAVLPFGIGQFQNGDRTAGWVFLATESLLVSGGIVTLPIYYVDAADATAAYHAQTQPIYAQYRDRALAMQYLNLSFYGALAVTAIAGAIQAEVAYVPEIVSIQPRIVPELQAPDHAPAPVTRTAPKLPFVLGAAPLPGRDARGVGGGTVSLGATF